MFTALFCALMMVAMLLMMVGMPAMHASRQKPSDQSQEPRHET